jgi:hypothetical protein
MGERQAEPSLITPRQGIVRSPARTLFLGGVGVGVLIAAIFPRPKNHRTAKRCSRSHPDRMNRIHRMRREPWGH